MAAPRFASALITGASSGLGRGLAERLGARGTLVVLVARRAELLAEARAGILAAGGRAEVEVLDVSDVQAVASAVQRWDERLGGLDLVVANAGVGRAVPAHRMQAEELNRTLSVNVQGACATLQAALGPMLARGRGTLVGMSSLAGVRGLPSSAAYSASKAALSTFCESLRIDLAGSGVEVVDVRPGFVRTPLTEANDLEMPFLLELDEAVERCLKGIDRGRAVVSFPVPMALGAGVARLLPARLWRALARRWAVRMGARKPRS